MVCLAYIDPQQIMPLTSVLAGVVGILLIFWSYFLRLLKYPFQALHRKKADMLVPVEDAMTSTPEASSPTESK